LTPANVLFVSTQTGGGVIVGEALLVFEVVLEAEDELVGEPVIETVDEPVVEPVIEPVDEPVVDASLEDQVMYGSVLSAIACARTDCCTSYQDVAAVAPARNSSTLNVAVASSSSVV
jgi:hypothetical protein